MVALRKWSAVLAVGFALAQPLMAHDMSKMDGMGASNAAAKPAKTPLATGAAFDSTHRLWVAWVEGQHVVVAHADKADGKRLALSPPVTVNAMPEPIYTSAENRPKIAASPDAKTI